MRISLKGILGVSSREEIIEEARKKLLEEYTEYCDSKKQDIWKETVQNFLSEIKENPNPKENEDFLIGFLCAGEYMKMRAENKSLEDIKEDFKKKKYSKYQKFEICSDLLEYSKDGIEIVDEIYGKRIPSTIRTIYDLVKSDRRRQTAIDNKEMIEKIKAEQNAKLALLIKSVNEKGHKVCEYCYEDQQKDWLEIVEDTLNGHSTLDGLIQVFVASEAAIMFEEEKSDKEVREYIDSKELSGNNLKNVMWLLIEYFSRGYDFVSSSYNEEELSEYIKDKMKEEKEYREEIEKKEEQTKLLESAQDELATLSTLCYDDKMKEFTSIVGTDINLLNDKEMLTENDENRLTSYIIIIKIALMIYDGKSWEEIKEVIDRLNLNDEINELVCLNMVKYFPKGVQFIKAVYDQNVPKRVLDYEQERVEEYKKQRKNNHKIYKNREEQCLTRKQKAKLLMNPRQIHKFLVK